MRWSRAIWPVRGSVRNQPQSPNRLLIGAMYVASADPYWRMFFSRWRACSTDTCPMCSLRASSACSRSRRACARISPGHRYGGTGGGGGYRRSRSGDSLGVATSRSPLMLASIGVTRSPAYVYCSGSGTPEAMVKCSASGWTISLRIAAKWREISDRSRTRPMMVYPPFSSFSTILAWKTGCCEPRAGRACLTCFTSPRSTSNSCLVLMAWPASSAIDKPSKTVRP